MRRNSPAFIGGIVGVLLFVGTIIAAVVLSDGDAKGTAVIAQLLNLHITLLLAVLGQFLPLAVVGDRLFQLLIGVTVNFILGGLIGMGIGTLIRRKKAKR